MDFCSATLDEESLTSFDAFKHEVIITFMSDICHYKISRYLRWFDANNRLMLEAYVQHKKSITKKHYTQQHRAIISVIIMLVQTLIFKLTV